MSLINIMVAQAGLLIEGEVEYLSNDTYRMYTTGVPTHQELAERMHRVGLTLHGYGRSSKYGWEIRFRVSA